MGGDFVFNTYILLDTRKPCEFKIPDTDIVLPFVPFYVGMGQKNRCKDHQKRVKAALKYKYDWYFKEGAILKKSIIKDILKRKLKVEFVILHENILRSEAAEFEKFYIKCLGRVDNKTGVLSNLTEGGESGTYERKVSEWKNFNIEDVKRKKQRDSLPVIQYCPFTDTYKKFDSIKILLGGISTYKHDRITIGNVCRGTHLQRKGFIYFWEKDFKKENIEIRKNNFLSMNPQRLAIAKKEYRKRYAEQCSK